MPRWYSLSSGVGCALLFTFGISGEIRGNQIDETFASGPETFSPIQSRESLEFLKASLPG